ncbi:MAG: HD domain-containing protein [Desulfobacterales bacterium]|nr:HD domain-containing protein [Desulfobacterales bacterium]
MVGNVAICLARYLKKETPGLNSDLIFSAALLHDITKTRSFETGELHSASGGELLTRMGYPEVGNIIRQHVVLDEGWEAGPITESEIVNYADKRVLHDKVVSLDRRLTYIKKRYGKDDRFKTQIKKMWDATQAIEVRLFNALPFTPTQLGDHIRPEIPRDAIPGTK